VAFYSSLISSWTKRACIPSQLKLRNGGRTLEITGVGGRSGAQKADVARARKANNFNLRRATAHHTTIACTHSKFHAMNGHPLPAMPPATPAWRAVTEEKTGKVYYFNQLTSKVTWEKPYELKDEVERAMIDAGWESIAAPEGSKKPVYWHNQASKQTTWDVPDDVQKVIDERKAKQAARPPPAAPAGPAGWAAGPMVRTSGGYDNRRSDRDDYQVDRRDRDRGDRDRDFGGDRPNFAVSTGSDLQFSSPQEAEAAFMKVLRQMKAQPDWDWPQAVRAGVKDPHWRAIAEPEKREEAFKKYCEDLRAQEKNKEQERQAKLRADFSAMLRSHPEIKHFTRWRTALPIIDEETIFRSAKDDSERRALFDEYIISLRKANDEKEAEDRRSALDEIMGLLQGLDLEPFTRWKIAEEKLESSDDFKDTKFKALSRMDVLNQFEKHIKHLQREHNDRVQADRQKKHRIERQNRDAFNSLLTELRDSAQLRAGTKWKEIHGLIENDPRYLAMLGQGGSSPMDLFWDALEEEEGKFRTLRRYALDVLEVSHFSDRFREA
jgi:pre-mRNA-processing factor 40